MVKIVSIGAAPTGLGAAYRYPIQLTPAQRIPENVNRLNELIGEGHSAAKDVEIVLLEKVCLSSFQRGLRPIRETAVIRASLVSRNRSLAGSLRPK